MLYGMKRSLKVLISLGFWGVARAYGGVRHLLGRGGRPICVVLYYHSVPDDQRKRFARQMDILRRWSTPVRADRAEPLPEGHSYAAVTFDDGFLSVASNAIPELEHRKIPATILVVAGTLGSLPGWLSESYRHNQSEITMSAEQLRALPESSVTLGSQTMTHRKLTELLPELAKREIVDSRLQLEKILNRPVTLFSFPYGKFNQELLRWCREAGYKRAFTTEPFLAFAEPGEFVTGRVSVDPTDWELEFWLKLVGAYRWETLVSAFKRKALSVWRERRRPMLEGAEGEEEHAKGPIISR